MAKVRSAEAVTRSSLDRKMVPVVCRSTFTDQEKIGSQVLNAVPPFHSHATDPSMQESCDEIEMDAQVSTLSLSSVRMCGGTNWPWA